MNQEQLDMISKFQCPGCSCGTHPADECSSFKPIEENMFDDVEHPFFHCEAHVPGTFMIPGGRIYLGLPKGFNKAGLIDSHLRNGAKKDHNIRLFSEIPTSPFYNELNVPVWAMMVDGYLFVRVYLPRLNKAYIDIVKLKEGQVQLPEGALNVGKFVDEID